MYESPQSLFSNAPLVFPPLSLCSKPIPMYSSSSSSPQQSSHDTNMLRYGSAPSSFFSNAVDSVMGTSQGHGQQQHQFFDSGVALNARPESTQSKMSESKNTLSLLRSYGLENDDRINMNSAAPPSPTSDLIRHSSSPAGFLNHLTSEIGFSMSKGLDSYNSQGSTSISGHKPSRLGSRLSFSSKQDQHSLAQIAEVNDCSFERMSSHENHDHNKRSATSQSHLVPGFSLSQWDDSDSQNIVFSASSSRQGKIINDDILNGLASIDAQALELATMDRLLHMPQDSVPCKIRAKRGYATHPRSIAERERRTRISGKLRKLQELVPNMDKQTSYSDMLDLAVQHIKGLQSQIQKLNDELENCTCGCKSDMHN